MLNSAGRRRSSVPFLIAALCVSVFVIGCEQEVPKPVAKSASKSDSKSDSNKSGSKTSPIVSKKTSTKIKRLILITNGDAPFWDACRSGMTDAAKKFQLKQAGYQAEFVRNDGKVKGQIDLLKQYGSQDDVAGIGISIISPENAAVAEEMEKLRAKGVEVITVDSDIDIKRFPKARSLYIGTDNRIGGEVLGVSAKNILPAGGEFVTFVGYKGSANAVQRIEGFQEGAGTKFVSKDSREDGLDYKKAVDNVRNALTDYKDLKMLVGIYAYNGPAAVDEVKRRGIRDSMKIVTFDADPRSIKQMEAGMIDVMVVQDPYHMGYHGIELLKALLDDDQATIDALKKKLPAASGAENVFDTALKVIIPDVGSPLKKEMFRKGVEFHTLTEFKKWLEEYGLAGS